MVAVDVTDSRREVAPVLGGKMVILETADSPTITGGTDYLTVTLADYGINTVLAVYGVVHTTANSVIVQEDVTTAVATGVLTVTTVAGNDDKKRVVTVIGK